MHAFARTDNSVAVLGHTTGSHLGLADEDERALTLIWVATVARGRLSRWRLLDDTPEHRADLGCRSKGEPTRDRNRIRRGGEIGARLAPLMCDLDDDRGGWRE